MLRCHGRAEWDKRPVLGLHIFPERVPEPWQRVLGKNNLAGTCPRFVFRPRSTSYWVSSLQLHRPKVPTQANKWWPNSRQFSPVRKLRCVWACNSEDDSWVVFLVAIHPRASRRATGEDESASYERLIRASNGRPLLDRKNYYSHKLAATQWLLRSVIQPQ